MRNTFSISILALSAFTCCKTPRYAGGYDTIESAKFQGPVREAGIVVIKKYANRPHADTISIDAYTLDRAGNVLTHRKRKKDITDSPTASAPTYSLQSESYSFDKHGQVTKVTREFDGTTDQSEIRYRRHKFTVTHTCNQKTSKTYSKMDQQGRTVYTESFRASGLPESKATYRYLPAGQEIEVFYFDTGGAVRLRRITHRDTVDAKVFYYTSDSGSRSDRSTTVSTLNAAGKVVSQVELDDTLGVIARKRWSYDQYGNETGYREYDNTWSSDRHNTCAYTYDGNRLAKAICDDTLLPGQRREQVKQTIYLDYDRYGNYGKKYRHFQKNRACRYYV